MLTHHSHLAAVARGSAIRLRSLVITWILASSNPHLMPASSQRPLLVPALFGIALLGALAFVASSPRTSAWITDNTPYLPLLLLPNVPNALILLAFLVRQAADWRAGRPLLSVGRLFTWLVAGTVGELILLFALSGLVFGSLLGLFLLSLPLVLPCLVILAAAWGGVLNRISCR